MNRIFAPQSNSFFIRPLFSIDSSNSNSHAPSSVLFSRIQQNLTIENDSSIWWKVQSFSENTMRIILVIVVTLMILSVALVPCAHAQPSESNLVNRKYEDEETSTPLGTHQELLNPWRFARGVERRSLKSKGSKSKPSSSRSRGRKGGTPTLIGIVISVSVLFGTCLCCTAFIIVTEKRQEDRNWRVRTFLRRKLKRKYTIKKRDNIDVDVEDAEKPHKVVETGDLDTPPPNNVEPADAK